MFLQQLVKRCFSQVWRLALLIGQQLRAARYTAAGGPAYSF